LAIPKNFFLSSIAIFVLWTVIIFGVTLIQTGGNIELSELVADRLVFAFIIAPAALFIFVFFNRNSFSFGLKRPSSWKSLSVLLFPAIFIVIFLLIAYLNNLPQKSVIGFILLNTLLVGISEELMFRGILYESFSVKFSFWKTIWYTSILFGVIHSLNGFITGNFLSAFAQSLQAIMFGVWIMSIRLRTKSIYLAMLVHGLWDFSVLLMSLSNKSTGASNPSAFSIIAFPVLLELPLFLYGLWLLIKVNKANTKYSE